MLAEYPPVAVGVPVIAPDVVLRLKPGGSAEVSENVTAPDAPLTVGVMVETAVPTFK